MKLPVLDCGCPVLSNLLGKCLRLPNKLLRILTSLGLISQMVYLRRQNPYLTATSEIEKTCCPTSQPICNSCTSRISCF